jgi:hypothetical protein
MTSVDDLSVYVGSLRATTVTPAQWAVLRTTLLFFRVCLVQCICIILLVSSYTFVGMVKWIAFGYMLQLFLIWSGSMQLAWVMSRSRSDTSAGSGGTVVVNAPNFSRIQPITGGNTAAGGAGAAGVGVAQLNGYTSERHISSRLSRASPGLPSTPLRTTEGGGGGGGQALPSPIATPIATTLPTPTGGNLMGRPRNPASYQMVPLPPPLQSPILKSSPSSSSANTAPTAGPTSPIEQRINKRATGVFGVGATNAWAAFNNKNNNGNNRTHSSPPPGVGTSAPTVVMQRYTVVDIDQPQTSPLSIDMVTNVTNNATTSMTS